VGSLWCIALFELRDCFCLIFFIIFQNEKKVASGRIKVTSRTNFPPSILRSQPHVKSIKQIQTFIGSKQSKFWISISLCILDPQKMSSRKTDGTSFSKLKLLPYWRSNIQHLSSFTTCPKVLSSKKNSIRMGIVRIKHSASFKWQCC